MTLRNRWLTMLPRLLVIAHDLAMVLVAWAGLRWLANIAGAPPAIALGSELVVVLLVQGSMLWLAGVYSGLWRFASLNDLLNLMRAVLAGLAVILVVLVLLGLYQQTPRRVLVPYMPVLFALLAVPRLLYRFWKDRRQAERHHDAKRVLILGAGGAAETLLRDMHNDGRYMPVGLLDDAHGKLGMRLFGIKVLGALPDLPAIARETAAELLVIAMPGADAEQLRRAVELCEQTGLPMRTVVRMSDQLGGSGHIELGEVAIEDLLGREPVQFDWEGVRNVLGGKRVLVTGAGGSIGSELALQCAKANVARLIVLERAELPLNDLVESLRSRYPTLDMVVVLADCGDAAACRRVLEGGVDYVFHAAACKHLPLLESQCREALRNNVLATSVIAQASLSAEVGHFVLISTDKAIEPVSMLGASKRWAELVCQAVFRGTGTALDVVRFGNVLDSTGSVVPLFRKQIASGGPVTVTHPDVSRYFMTIPEACQLILQTSALPHQGSRVFTLDMGRPVAIRELAEQMIRLAGKQPGEDIEITYIGLRTGEKLHERLFHPEERYERTANPRILQALPVEVDARGQLARIALLQSLLDNAVNDTPLLQLLAQAVPEYSPANSGATVEKESNS